MTAGNIAICEIAGGHRPPLQKEFVVKSSDCHVGAGTNRVDWAADTPKKVMARSMINMVATQTETHRRM